MKIGYEACKNARRAAAHRIVHIVHARYYVTALFTGRKSSEREDLRRLISILFSCRFIVDPVVKLVAVPGMDIRLVEQAFEKTVRQITHQGDILYHT